MGWLLNIIKIAETTEIKCTECGNDTVEFVARDGRMLMRCRNCFVSTELKADDLRALKDKSPTLPPDSTRSPGGGAA
jgi:hypothetical protein